jgi:hypothetical protein
MVFDFLLEHGPAGPDPLNCIGVKFDFFAVAGYADEVFDGKAGTCDDDCHGKNRFRKESRVTNIQNLELPVPERCVFTVKGSAGPENGTPG